VGFRADTCARCAGPVGHRLGRGLCFIRPPSPPGLGRFFGPLRRCGLHLLLGQRGIRIIG
jgi:hypothetical protein